MASYAIQINVSRTFGIQDHNFIAFCTNNSNSSRDKKVCNVKRIQKWYNTVWADSWNNHSAPLADFGVPHDKITILGLYFRKVDVKEKRVAWLD